jgi:cyclase
VLGNPTTAVRRLSDWASDELVYLDISPDAVYDQHRGDLKHDNRGTIVEIVKDVAEHAFMPLTFGGGIRTLDDVLVRIVSGADKVSVNTAGLARPDFLAEISREFGTQSLVASIDAKRHEDGTYEVFGGRGKEPTGRDPRDWAAEVEQHGAGEIFLNSIDRDGRGQGYDIELIASVVERVSIPVIACGGVGTWDHLAEGIRDAGAAAVAAANIFHYTENSVRNAKRHLVDQGLPVRPFEAGALAA